MCECKHSYHVVQADAPALEQNLTGEAVHKCKPDLKDKKAMQW